MTYISKSSAIKRYKATADSPTTSDVFSYDSLFGYKPDTLSQLTFFNPANISSYSGGRIVENNLDFTLDMNNAMPEGLYYCRYELSIQRVTNSPIFFNDGNANYQHSYINSDDVSGTRNCFNRHNTSNNGVPDARRFNESSHPIGAFKYKHNVFSHGNRNETNRSANIEVEFTCYSGTYLSVSHSIVPTLCFSLDDGSGTSIVSTSDFTISHYSIELIQFEEDIPAINRKFI
jgi:hypothetical protein